MSGISPSLFMHWQYFSKIKLIMPPPGYLLKQLKFLGHSQPRLTAKKKAKKVLTLAKLVCMSISFDEG